jgi:hypothetical protein
MAETVALGELLIIACLVFAIVVLNDELKRKDGALKFEPIPPNYERMPDAPPAPRTITAKDIAAENLKRQVTRATKGWANKRLELETLTDRDPEVARSKRVEKFIGDN